MIEKIKNELTINELKDMVSECNSWNGSLNEYYYWENDEYFFEIFYNNNVIDAVRAVCYGEYNYLDDLVQITWDGNLYSCSNNDYEKELEENANEIIETYIENIDNMSDYDLKSKVKNLMEEYNEKTN